MVPNGAEIAANVARLVRVCKAAVPRVLIGKTWRKVRCFVRRLPDDFGKIRRMTLENGGCDGRFGVGRVVALGEARHD